MPQKRRCKVCKKALIPQIVETETKQAIHQQCIGKNANSPEKMLALVTQIQALRSPSKKKKPAV
jgi:hypothetical protein